MAKIQAWEASDGSLHKERADYQRHELEIILAEAAGSDRLAVIPIEKAAQFIAEQQKAVIALLTLTENSRPGGRKALKKTTTPKPEPAEAT